MLTYFFHRYDLCDLSSGISCSMLGIAYVGTPCTKDKACSVNEDSGLKVGLTIAHELGHMCVAKLRYTNNNY